MKKQRHEAKETYLRWTDKIIEYEAEQVNETLLKEKADLDTLKENFVASISKIQQEAYSLKTKIKEERTAQLLTDEEVANVKKMVGLNLHEIIEVFEKAVTRKDEEVEQIQRNKKARQVQARLEFDEMHEKVSKEYDPKWKGVTYKYKRLPLAGVDVGDDFAFKEYFQSISEPEFREIKDKENYRVESLQVIHQNYDSLGGFQLKLSDGKIYKCGKQLDYNFQSTLDLKEASIGTIQVQKTSEIYNGVRGWKFFNKSDNSVLMDSRKEINGQDINAYDYAKLSPKEDIIGIYGYLADAKQIVTCGFIAKEAVFE